MKNMTPHGITGLERVNLLKATDSTALHFKEAVHKADDWRLMLCYVASTGTKLQSFQKHCATSKRGQLLTSLTECFSGTIKKNAHCELILQLSSNISDITGI
jgi:hypothetical protein